MSERDDKFNRIIFSPANIKELICMVPSKVFHEFVVRRTGKPMVSFESMDENYYMEFHKFMQQQYVEAITMIQWTPTPYSDLRNDVVEQSKRDATEDDDKELDSLSENDSNYIEEDADEDENATDENVQESEDFDEKLLKDKEKFAYKLRKLRAQLFEQNGNGSMNSTSVDYYEKLVKKFVRKFKHHRMPKNVRLLKYEVNLWNKKVLATKEALALDVKDGKNGPSVSEKASDLSEELHAVSTGITQTSSNVSVTSSPGLITCSNCGSARNTGNAVAEHDV